jgi:hypothetical protein
MKQHLATAIIRIASTRRLEFGFTDTRTAADAWHLFKIESSALPIRTAGNNYLVGVLDRGWELWSDSSSGNSAGGSALVSAMNEKQITHLVGLALGGLLFIALALNALAS